jgi:peptide/nickel transport system ATP-binding protein
MSEASSADNRLLQVNGLKKYFKVEKGFLKRQIGVLKAVDDVSFSIDKGETLGVVGESGSGKTTLGMTILRGIDPTGGQVLFRFREGTVRNVPELEKEELAQFRRDAQMIFQDPYSSLDPRMTVMDIITEPVVVSKIAKGAELRSKAEDLMRLVGLDARYLKRYPHAFSGGQRQRIGIARALSTNPRFIVADEPTSALDVSIQAQILNLLKDLQAEFDLTYLFISHNLGVIKHICNRILIMYLGRVVEGGTAPEVLSDPKHPYTEGLLRCLPIPDPRIKSAFKATMGEPGDPAHPPSACPFHPRCEYAQGRCSTESPPLVEVSVGHTAACHFAAELHLKGL